MMQKKIRTYIAVGGTFACALGVGFVMQHGRDVPMAAAPNLEPVPIQAKAIGTPEQDVAAAHLSVSPDAVVTRNAAIPLNDVTLTATAPQRQLPRALPDEPEIQQVSLTDPESFSPTPSDPATPQLGCNLMAQATEIQAAMVRITLAAPCYANERVTVHHSGMMFTAVTDQSGGLSVDVPALTEQAIFILALANGKGAVAQARVPSVNDFDRIALQWSGDAGFQIHAREYGAGYSDQGHVWSGSTRSSVDVASGEGGFVTRLGSADTLAPQLVEVYSFPSAAADKAGSVAISIEAEITDNNCGRDVSAQVLNLGPDRVLQTRDLVLAVPDCDAVGDFLVLNNLVDDLKIAGK